MTAACPSQAPVTTPGWPLRSGLELAAFPTAVPCARLHARHITLEWGLRALAEPTELLVSELATNAIRASAGTYGRNSFSGIASAPSRNHGLQPW